jgi:hypothetical protein
VAQSPYNTQYTPNAVSSNWMVNTAYQMGTNMMGMSQSPGFVMGQRPSDTMFVVNGGSQRNQKAHEDLVGHINIINSLRNTGGEAGNIASTASGYDNMANSYLSQFDFVKQATGGNLDEFSRRMIGGATSIAGGGDLTNAPGANSWQKQMAFHQQHVQRAKSFGKSILDSAYVGGDATKVNKSFTRGFKIEEVADVVSQLGYEGGVSWTNRDGSKRSDEQNKDVVSQRLGKLAAARNVFGEGDVNSLQQQTQQLLGSSLGSNDDASGKILQQISAEARVLNKDVKNMVKSREVIKNTLVSLNKARDSRGVNLTYDGTGSISGDMEVTANAIGSLVDHATAGLPGKTQAAMSRNMTRTLIKDVDSDAGQLAKLMQAGMMSGEVSKEDYNIFQQAQRSGNTRGASDIARRTIKDVDKIMSDKVLFENTIGWMNEGAIKNQFGGNVAEFQKANAGYSTQRVRNIALGGSAQQATRMQEMGTKRRLNDMRKIRRITGVEEDEYTDENKIADYKKDLAIGAGNQAENEKTIQRQKHQRGDLTDDQLKEKLAEIDSTLADDLVSIKGVSGDSVSDVRGAIRSGKVGISEARADNISDVADAGFTKRRARKYFKKVQKSGKLGAYTQLDSLVARKAISKDQMAEIMDIDDKEERQQKIEGIIGEHFGGDTRQEDIFRKQTSAEAGRMTNMYLRDVTLSGDRGFIDHKTYASRNKLSNAVGKQAGKSKDISDAATDDMKASESLAGDKNNAEKILSGIQELAAAVTDGQKANLDTYGEGGVLKVKIINPEEVKPSDPPMVESGSGG